MIFPNPRDVSKRITKPMLSCIHLSSWHRHWRKPNQYPTLIIAQSKFTNLTKTEQTELLTEENSCGGAAVATILTNRTAGQYSCSCSPIQHHKDIHVSSAKEGHVSECLKKNNLFFQSLYQTIIIIIKKNKNEQKSANVENTMEKINHQGVYKVKFKGALWNPALYHFCWCST